MPRLTKLFTRKGDEGETSLGGGQRVPKDSLRLGAIGMVDELNSALGVALAHNLSPCVTEILGQVQNQLFHLGSDLCFLEEDQTRFNIPHIEARHIAQMEKWIDELNVILGPLENFILPGGSAASAHLHLARTICRRTEREVIALARREPIGEYVLPYLNRLSDMLFVMARYENKQLAVPEPLWDPRG